MTNLLLLERFLRFACFTFIGVLFVLVACGPGGGGTGTGPMAFTSAGTTVNVGTGTASGGPIVVDGAAAEACGRLDLQLEEGRVELASASCGHWVFNGPWAADASHKALLSGLIESPAGGAVPATLLLEFSGTPETTSFVTVTLTNEAGIRLLGPQVLGRAPI